MHKRHVERQRGGAVRVMLGAGLGTGVGGRERRIVLGVDVLWCKYKGWWRKFWGEKRSKDALWRRWPSIGVLENQ